MDTPLYQPLDPARQEIRLLRIQPTDDGYSLRCELVTYSLLQPQHTYHAVSYAWGDAADTEPVHVNGHPLRVTKNLAAFLRWFHDVFLVHSPDRKAPLVWADALCIDQNNIAERNDQVQLMASIYRSAKLTLAWLGPAADDSHFALHNIGLMSDEIEAHRKRCEDAGEAWDMSGDPWAWVTARHAAWFRLDVDLGAAVPMYPAEDYNRFWRSTQALLSRPYWRRAWVVQELVLPKSVAIVCGARIVDFASVWTVASWLGTLSGVPRPPVVDEGLWTDLSTRVGRTRLGWAAAVNPASFLSVQQEHQRDGTQWPVLWRRFVLLTKPQLATDPRDKLYSVLGLLEPPGRPDYSLPVEQVYRDFAELCLRAGSRLDMTLLLSGHGLNPEGWEGTPDAPPYSLFVPSWVPNWDLLSKKVGLLYLQQCFEPTRDFQMAVNNTQDPCWSLEGNKLIVQGRSCDRAALCSMVRDVESRASFCKTVMQKSGSSYVSGIPILQALIRALFLDRDLAAGKPLGPRPAPLLILKLASYALVLHQLADWPLGVEPNHLLGRLGLSSPKHLLQALIGDDIMASVPLNLLDRTVEIWSQVFRAQLRAHRDRSPMATLRALDGLVEGWTLELVLNHIGLLKINTAFMTEKGRLGWGPPGMQAGDLICLVGDDLPVVLRKVDSHYLHIGVCFVLGFDCEEELETVKIPRKSP